MIFKGTPNMFVRLQRPIGNIKGIRFDSNGCYETDNPRLIRILSSRYEEKKEEGILCKYCGEMHENKGQVLVCARKSKSTKKKEQ